MKKNKVGAIVLILELIILVAELFFAVVLFQEKKEFEVQTDEKKNTLSVSDSEQNAILSETEILKISEDCLREYRSMYGEYFMTFLQTDGVLTEEDEVTINGIDHYVLVTDERYPTLQSVKDHIEIICTKEHAEKLYAEQWDLNGMSPFLAELDGRLYTQVADAPFGVGNLYVPLAYLNKEGNIVFFYKCVHDEKSDYEWTEEGIMTLEKKNDKWYVKNDEEWE